MSYLLLKRLSHIEGNATSRIKLNCPCLAGKAKQSSALTRATQPSPFPCARSGPCITCPDASATQSPLTHPLFNTCHAHFFGLSQLHKRPRTFCITSSVMAATSVPAWCKAYMLGPAGAGAAPFLLCFWPPAGAPPFPLVDACRSPYERKRCCG